MNAPRAGGYRVQVGGHLDDHWAEWLGVQSLHRNDDATTTVTLDSADQARLHGVLARIRDLGADLLAVQAEPGSLHPPTLDQESR